MNIFNPLDNKPVETLQQVNAPRDGNERLTTTYATPSNKPFEDTNPNIVTPGNFVVPGSQLFGMSRGWNEYMFDVQDTNHYEITQTVNQPLYYRSMPSARVDSRTVRYDTPSVTTPVNGINSVRFVNGRQGDIYGS